MRLIALIFLVLAVPVCAQESTPEPTDEISTIVYATITAAASQTVAIDYTVTAGDVYLANLLTFIAFSVWAIFLFCVMVFFLVMRRK